MLSMTLPAVFCYSQAEHRRRDSGVFDRGGVDGRQARRPDW